MTTTVRPENSLAAVLPPPGKGPLARVILGSLLTGLVGALVLTLLVFPGAPEHTITGSILLAFGSGWAMLAVLSTRLTSKPQRWALVPAAVLAVTGLALMTSGPDDGVLTGAGWVWPPALFILALWMIVQLRRGMTGRLRWLLYPVIGALVMAAVGGFAETVALQRDAGMRMPGTSYDVGSHRLHLRCAGAGSPTVVLQSGLGEMSLNWARIAPAVAASTRVCAYDRAGQGWSGDASGPQDGLAVATDLHALLAAAGEPAPYVLVGHSTGGAYAMTYAARYPAQVAGMVLLDSSTPDQFTALPQYPSTYAMMRRGLGLGPTVARLGVGRLVPERAMSELPSPEAGQYRAFATSSRGMRNMRDEFSALRAAFAQAGALRTLSGKPLAVLTAADGQQPGWSAAQDRLAALSSNSSHQIIDTTHDGLIGDQPAADAAALAITDVVRTVRAGGPAPTR
ncbi:MAG: alpha/beta hydrolase [Jatrophihabitantaceae bacterium]